MLDEGEVGTLVFAVRNVGPGALLEPTATLTSATAGVTFPDGASLKLGPLPPFGKATTLKVHVQLHGAAPVTPLAIDIAVSDPSFGDGRVRRLQFGARGQADEAPQTATLDRVDTRGTSWVALGEDASGTTKTWARLSAGLDGRWTVPDPFEPADHTLTSPSFTIDGTTFELGFKHRWSMRISTRRKVDVDGGVVEVSVDKGKTWRDVSELGGTVDYNTTIDTGGRGDNPLKGRRAYGNKSPGYPDQWVSSRLKLDLKTRPESVKVRFHLASGTGFAGAPGWEIDDIDLVGISSTPFWSFVAHADLCDENGPQAFAGPGQVVKSKQAVVLVGTGSHPTDLPIAFAWTQVGGPAVDLQQGGSPRAELVAPDTLSPITLTFELRANDGALLSAGSRVEVVVLEADPTQLRGGGGGCSTSRRTPARSTGWSLAISAGLVGLLVLGLVARRRIRLNPPR